MACTEDMQTSLSPGKLLEGARPTYTGASVSAPAAAAAAVTTHLEMVSLWENDILVGQEVLDAILGDDVLDLEEREQGR